MHSCFLSLVDIVEFHTCETHSRMGLIGVVYNVNKLSGLKKESVIVLIKPSILTDWEKI
jgi:hypothetical protein